MGKKKKTRRIPDDGNDGRVVSPTPDACACFVCFVLLLNPTTRVWSALLVVCPAQPVGRK